MLPSSLKAKTLISKVQRLTLLCARRFAMPQTKIIDSDTLTVKIAEKIVSERRRTGSYKMSVNTARTLVLAELEAVTPSDTPAINNGMFVTD
jgi:hypothetical protein